MMGDKILTYGWPPGMLCSIICSSLVSLSFGLSTSVMKVNIYFIFFAGDFYGANGFISTLDKGASH